MQMPRFNRYIQNHCVDLLPCFSKRPLNTPYEFIL